jgi:hypothetical protein
VKQNKQAVSRSETTVGTVLLFFLTACPPVFSQTPRRYFAQFAVTPPVIDGRMNEAAWATIPWSDDFVDIEGDARPEPRLRTRFKMIWDSTAVYIVADMIEPQLWATITQRDAVIFHDNDFEVFLDPDGDGRAYFELEINALNTVWDLFLPVRYRDGGRARNAWDMAGLLHAVNLRGTLNDPSDTDHGWSVELAIPYADLRQPEVTTAIPRVGTVWRVNFSRVQWNLAVVDGRYVKTDTVTAANPHPEMNWVWSPMGLVDMHLPDRWGYVEFVTQRRIGRQ